MAEPLEKQKKIVTVTGATGYLAGHIIKILLEKGYEVRATMRNPDKKERVKHLVDIAEQTAGEIKFYAGDLTVDGSFDESIAGADVVIHTASPVQMTSKNPMAEIVMPAKNGMKNVLNACKQSPSVKKVILTSSVAAVKSHKDTDKPGEVHTFNDDDWNTTADIKSEPYPLSKTEAEKTAWEIAKDCDFSLVTICPSLVVGPVLKPGSLSISLQLVKALIAGEYPRAPDLHYCMVDVRDCAMTHVIAMEKEDIKDQRYICSSQNIWSALEMANALKKNFPYMPVPTKAMPNFVMYAVAMFDKRLTWSWLRANLGVKNQYDNTKIVEQLGIEFRAPEESLCDTVESFFEHNIVQKPLQVLAPDDAPDAPEAPAEDS